jgi:hypothetical protein
MGNYRTTYMELDDFRVSCIQGYPYHELGKLLSGYTGTDP